MGFNTKVSRHASQDDLADVALAELQDEVVVLRAIDLVGVDHNSLAVLNEGFVTLEPVGSRTGKAVKVQCPTAIEHLDLVHHILDGSAEFPRMIGGIVVVR